jgi:predicted dehydrogenase
MTKKETINIGLIGHKFMGRLHTHAYTNVRAAFDLELAPVKKVLCGIGDDLEQTAKKWGWEEWTDDWHSVVDREDIDVIDIAAPSILHKEIAIAAAKKGKHVFCEKPMALNLDDAREMIREINTSGVKNTIGFNYRKAPAIALAKQLIDEGKIGKIYHFRGMYSQDWLVDPTFPLAWRLRKAAAGAGSSWDLGAHVVDLARYLVGEIDEVVGSQATFIEKRPIAVVEDGLSAIAGKEMGVVDVDDATSFLARFKNGAMGLFEVTRFGTGHKNENRIEIYGSEGGLIWPGFEKQSELYYFSRSDPDYAQGYRTIQIGEGIHPYGSGWWPVGHTIGFGATFVHEIYDFLTAIIKNEKASPSFEDGMKCQEILAAVDKSIADRSWTKVDSM